MGVSVAWLEQIPQHSPRASKFGKDFFALDAGNVQFHQQQCYSGCGKGEGGSVSTDFAVSLTRGSLVGQEGEEKGKSKGNTS